MGDAPRAFPKHECDEIPKGSGVVLCAANELVGDAGPEQTTYAVNWTRKTPSDWLFVRTELTIAAPYLRCADFGATEVRSWKSRWLKLVAQKTHCRLGDSVELLVVNFTEPRTTTNLMVFSPGYPKVDESFGAELYAAPIGGARKGFDHIGQIYPYIAAVTEKAYASCKTDPPEFLSVDGCKDIVDTCVTRSAELYGDQMGRCREADEACAASALRAANKTYASCWLEVGTQAAINAIK